MNHLIFGEPFSHSESHLCLEMILMHLEFIHTLVFSHFPGSGGFF